MTRKAPIQFPPTPEHPKVENPELTYRKEFLKMLDHSVTDAVIVGNKACTNTLAFRKAAEWVHCWLLKGARHSVEELGPLSSAAQKIEISEFVRSLEENDKGFDA